MVRRRNAEDINGLGIPAQACCAKAVAQKRDRSRGGAAFTAGQLRLSLNVRRSCGTDPGPAGFDGSRLILGKLTLIRCPAHAGSG
jgi:hypothetical protein